MDITKKSVLSNLIWRLAERCGAQGVTFIVSIVLARMLEPEAYGVIALVTVFTSILHVFVDSGLGNALIQKKDADDLDFSTVFYFNVFICACLYLITFFIAPFIACFYENTDLIPVIRVLGLTLLISGVKNVQQAYVSKNLQFKRFFFATLGGTIGAAMIGIVMAFMGFGVWALVMQQVFNTAVDTMILWITVRFRPKRVFSFTRLKGLFSFGWKMLVSSLIDTAYNNVRQLIIGKIYLTTDLAYYNKGKQFPNFIITNINAAIDSVLFPVISNEQDSTERVKALTRRSIKISSFIIWPVVMGMAACAETIVSILLTDKWLPCVPFMQIFCLTYGFWPIHTANLNAIKAVGRSDIFLKLEVMKKIIGIISILVSMPFGVLPMALAYLITAPISAFINAYPNRKLLRYSYKEQIQDMMPAMLLAFIMAIVVYLISKLHINMFIVLSSQVIVGICIYVGGTALLRFESLHYIMSFIKDRKS